MAGARQRLATAGNALSEHHFAGGTALVARQHVRRTLSSVDLTTFILPVDHATPEIVQIFVHAAAQAATREPTSSLIWSTVTALPVVVSEHVTPEAREAALARKPFKVRLGRKDYAFMWPAVLDLATGERLYFKGSFWIGRYGSDWVRERLLEALGPRNASTQTS
jgi:hypothetical protein